MFEALYKLRSPDCTFKSVGSQNFSTLNTNLTHKHIKNFHIYLNSHFANQAVIAHAIAKIQLFNNNKRRYILQLEDMI